MLTNPHKAIELRPGLSFRLKKGSQIPFTAIGFEKENKLETEIAEYNKKRIEHKR